MKVKTIDTEKIWQSPDGQKTIWAVKLKDENGADYQLKTYSEAIGQMDFEGEVETYLNSKGDRFVKQKAPEGGYHGGRGGAPSAAKLEADAKKQQEIRAEWAIGKAIQANGIFPLDKDALKKTADTATQLYAMVDTVINAAGVAQ